MELDEKHKKTLDAVLSILREELPGLAAVIVFGSFGSEYERAESDLDLAILMEKHQDATDSVFLWTLAQKIASKIGRDVEIINLRQASTVFAFQVLTSGTTVYCANDFALASFDTLIMSMYQRLQEERKEILDDYEKGIFYG